VCMHIRDLAYYVDGSIVNGLVLTALGSYRDSVADSPVREQEAA
jgi:squalene-hopene/tetraprenyl-beta-curcumene cyclase